MDRMFPSNRQHLSGLEQVETKKSPPSIILPDGNNHEPLGSGIISGILGSGGMATVYEIWNSQLEINRAVKLLHPNHTEETRQRFQTEIKITAKLQHPNIIEIHAVGQWNGLPYIEMERIDGFTLEKILEIRGALPLEVCTSIAIMIGRALSYAHNHDYMIYGNYYHGVIHRDLKPSNVMLSHSGVVKLMDFGIARPTNASIHTTADGAILGTMQYLSPEQIEGKEPDVRADIYTLGTLLYELITGIKVFPEQNMSKLMLAKVRNDYRPINAYNIKIPHKLCKLVHSCLVHEREHRVQNANEFLTKLTAVHSSLTHLTPENVLADFITDFTQRERVVVQLRKRIPVSVILFFLILSTATVLLITFGSDRLIVPEKKSVQRDSVITGIAPLIPQTQMPQYIPDNNLQKTNEQEMYRIQGKSRKNTRLVKSDSTQVKSDTQMLMIHHQDYTADSFLKLVDNENYQQALAVYPKLAPNELSDKVQIYRIRSLRRIGDQKELKKALFSQDINDGEMYLERAKFLIENDEYTKAFQELNKCSTSPSSYMQSSSLRLERLYYTAICVTKKFDQNPSNETKNDALGSWFEVKSELQTSKNHSYFKAAESEMQRITRKMNLLKG